MRVRPILLLFALAPVVLSAQSQTAEPAAPAKTVPAPLDPQMHADALKLVELSGARKRMADSMDAMMEQGKAEMLKRYPALDPRFADEWVKRMKARTNLDDYIEVVASVYQKHFSHDEILALIQIQQDAKDGKKPTVSDALRTKLTDNAVAIQSEILGGCTQVGAKLGGEVGTEIAREHPDWQMSRPDAKPPVQP